MLERNLDKLDGTASRSSRTTTSISRDTATMSRSLDQGADSINQLTGRMRVLGEIAATVGPALIPIGAAAIPAVTGLAAQFGFAALAGGTAVAAFHGVGDALKAMNKAGLEPTTENLRAAQVAMEAVSPAAQDLVTHLRSMGPMLKEIRDNAATEMFPGVIEGLESMESLLPDVQRIVGAVAGELGNIASSTGASLASDRWTEFFAFLATDAPSALQDMAKSAGNVGHAMAEMWMAFDPLNDDFSSWMVKATGDLDKWATGLSKTEGFAEFVDYIRTMGPQVGDTLAAVGNALVQIVQAAAPIGGPVLAGIEAFAKAIGAIADSDLGTPLFGMVAALSAVNLAMRATAGISAASFGGPALAGIQKQTGGMKNLATQARSLGGDMKAMGVNYLTAGANSERMAATQSRVASSFKTMGAAAGKAGAGVAALGVLSTEAGQGLGITNTAMLALGGAMMGGPLGAGLGATAGAFLDLKAAGEPLSKMLDDLQASASQLSFSEFNAELKNVKSELADINNSDGFLDFFSDGIKATAGQLNGDLKGVGDGFKAPQVEIAAMTNALGAAQRMAFTSGIAGEAAAAGFNLTAAGAAAAAAAGDTLAKSMANAANNLGAMSAEDQLTSSLLDMRDALKESGPVLRDNGDAMLKHQRAGLQMRAGLQNIAAAYTEANSKMKDGFAKTEHLDKAHDSFVKMATAAGMAVGPARAMAKELGLIDSLDPKVKLNVMGAEESAARVKKLNTEMRSLKDKRVRAIEQGADPSSARVRKLDAAIKALKSKVVQAKEEGAAASGARVISLRGKIAALKGKVVEAKENGAAASSARVQGLLGRINAMRDNEVTLTTNIVTVRRDVRIASSAGVSANPTMNADGGSVPKTGMSYADRHHYLLADGEEVVSNRHGQADRWRPLLKAINANRLAEGGTAGLADGGTATGGFGSISVTFPSPGILKAAVLAAQQIAAQTAATARSAKDLRDSRLGDLQAQQRIRDIQKSLTERGDKVVGTGKKKRTLKGQGALTLVGLNRTVAWAELADAKAARLEARAQLRLDAVAAMNEKIAASTATLRDTSSVFDRGSSPQGALNSINRQIADIGNYGQVIARLKAAKASPALLSQVVAKAESGDFRSAIRFGQAVLAQPQALTQLNAALATRDQIAKGVASITADPRFATVKAWNPTAQAPTVTKVVTVNVQADPSTWTGDLARVVTHNIQTALAGG